MEPYVGEIRMFAGNFAPAGWALCNGATLSIAEYDLLFMLLGTTYGGDGQTTFKLPDLTGRIPVHTGTNVTTGTNYVLGQQSGTENVTLVSNQLPAHTHLANANGVQAAATSESPTNNVWGFAANPITNYTNQTPNTTMLANTISPVGNNMPHDNMMPSLAINFIIALYGIFPPQN